MKDLLLTSQFLGSFGNMSGLELITTWLVFVKPLVSLGLKVSKLLDFWHGLRDSHRVLLIKEEELLLVVVMDGLDLVHEGVKQYMLFEVSLEGLH